MKKSQSSEYFSRLEKGLGIDKKGNVRVEKSLEVKGTTKLNGGFEPIHSYEIQADIVGYRLIVLFEKYDSINETYSAFGFIEHDGDSIYPGVFDYSINNGAITYFYGVFENKVYQLDGGSITESEITVTSN